MKGTILTLAIVFGVVWILATFNSCQQSAAAHPFGGPDGFWTAEKKMNLVKFVISKELDLSDAQQAGLDRIVADLKLHHDRNQNNADGLKTELMQELNKDRVSADELLQVVEKYRPAMEAKVDIMGAKLAEFHGLLTPEQRAMVSDHIKEHADGGCRFGRRFSRSDNADEIEKRLDIVKYMISSELELSDDQQVALDAVMRDMQLQHDAMHADAQAFKAAMLDLWHQEQLSADAFQQVFDAHKPALENMVTVMAQKVETLHAMLTPEQRAIVLDRMASAGHGCRFGRSW